MHRADVVKWLCADRARAIPNVREIRASRSRDDLVEGNLLLYLPDQQLADGAAQDASGGFFDVNNTPACDTWVALIRDENISSRDQLICFVPREMRAVVQRGIDVKPEGCILWLRDSTSAAAAAVRSFL